MLNEQSNQVHFQQEMFANGTLDFSQISSRSELICVSYRRNVQTTATTPRTQKKISTRVFWNFWPILIILGILNVQDNANTLLYHTRCVRNSHASSKKFLHFYKITVYRALLHVRSSIATSILSHSFVLEPDSFFSIRLATVIFYIAITSRKKCFFFVYSHDYAVRCAQLHIDETGICSIGN